MSAVTRAIAAAMAAQQRLAGETITYRVGEAISVELVAVPTAPQFQLTNDQGVVVDQTQYRDWLVIAAQLETDEGEPITPESGHVIEWTDEKDTPHRFEVGSAGGTEVWRWMDAQQVGRRIHSLEIAAE